MNADIHFEVVLDAAGKHMIYFSDEVRKELPPTVASDVAMTIRRTNAAEESLVLKPDAAGTYWLAKGKPIKDPGAVAHVTYSYKGKPYWIDVPMPKAEDHKAEGHDHSGHRH